jgi:hypothetical protein
MIARLAWRLSGLVVDAHSSDGDSTWFPKMTSVGVYLTFKMEG